MREKARVRRGSWGGWLRKMLLPWAFAELSPPSDLILRSLANQGSSLSEATTLLFCALSIRSGKESADRWLVGPDWTPYHQASGHRRQEDGMGYTCWLSVPISAVRVGGGMCLCRKYRDCIQEWGQEIWERCHLQFNKCQLMCLLS